MSAVREPPGYAGTPPLPAPAPLPFGVTPHPLQTEIEQRGNPALFARPRSYRKPSCLRTQAESIECRQYEDFLRRLSYGPGARSSWPVRTAAQIFGFIGHETDPVRRLAAWQQTHPGQP